MSATPTPEQQALRERIKLAIQTAQDSEGRLLYVIPPGVAGMYADAVMRALFERPYPYGRPTVDERGGWCHTRHSCHHWFEGECSDECDRGEHDAPHGHAGCTDRTSPISETGP